MNLAKLFTLVRNHAKLQIIPQSCLSGGVQLNKMQDAASL